MQGKEICQKRKVKDKEENRTREKRPLKNPRGNKENRWEEIMGKRCVRNIPRTAGTNFHTERAN